MTAWSAALGLSIPIVCAPMGGVAGGSLATAVSAAGALGMIGMGSSGSAVKLREQLGLVGERARIGIGLVDWVQRRDEHLLETALAAQPVLLSVSFGDNFDWVELAQSAGISTVTQAASADEAKRAVDAGIDAVVARGSEGGGHGRPLAPRDDVLDAVLQAVDVPVLAAGAIATADDLTAMLGRGAAAAWVGTAFSACAESLSSPGTRAALIAADGRRTMLTSAFDRAAGHDWPSDIPERVLVNEFTDRWPEATDVDAEAIDFFRRAETADDPNGICVNAGMGVGAITESRPAADVISALFPG